MIHSLTRTLLGLLLMVVTLMAVSRHATAVPIPNACCTFTVDVAGFDPTCFPVKLTTQWTGVLQSDLVPGNGVFLYNIIPCPPIPATFFWASLDGGLTKAEFNAPANFKVNGCCFTIRIGIDITGWIVVYLRPC